MFILLHSVCSLLALIIGSVSLMSTKGTTRHKILGWIFTICMYFSALSSFGIYHKSFSVIHLLSALVLIWLSRAIYAIRFKPKNWLYIHTSSIGSAYIATLIAGAGVLVRKVLMPGNNNAGYIASGVIAIILIHQLRSSTLKYK